MFHIYLEGGSGNGGAIISGLEDFGVSGIPVTNKFSINLTFFN